MLAVADENPYPLDSRSHSIWERNHSRRNRDVSNANDRDRYIIYLYVMHLNMSKVARMVELSDITIRKVLQKYHII